MDTKEKTTRSILKDHGIEDEDLERELLTYWLKVCRNDVKRKRNQLLSELKSEIKGKMLFESHSKIKTGMLKSIKIIEEMVL